MNIKAIGFDIGGTLINYNKPLNWSSSYEDALKFMCDKNKIDFTEKRFEQAKAVLEKYNTRINPREEEVTSEVIFGEIFEKWDEDLTKLYESKKAFYLFFQREAFIYNDTKEILEFCRQNNIKCAVYTDVAYGMDDEFSLNDISEIKDYIDLKLTSENVGFRKPNPKGFEKMLESFNCSPKEMVYIGDEEKDIKGAKNVGMYTILIDRKNQKSDYGQDFTVESLDDVIKIIRSL